MNGRQRQEQAYWFWSCVGIRHAEGIDNLVDVINYLHSGKDIYSALLLKSLCSDWCVGGQQDTSHKCVLCL